MDYLLSKEKVKRWPKDMVAARRFHTVGLKSDGTVVAVGNNEFGQCDVGSWRDILLPGK
jgi:alpha-tubulin suppressor-like RCC1 family protein